MRDRPVERRVPLLEGRVTARLRLGREEEALGLIDGDLLRGQECGLLEPVASI